MNLVTLLTQQRASHRVSPHPSPLPQGEGAGGGSGCWFESRRIGPALGVILPLPKGEGRGEGEGDAFNAEFFNRQNK